jgi:tRNA A22 N-methylase
MVQMSKFKVRYIGGSEALVLMNGKIYDVLSVEKTWYRIVDESDEDYLYPPELFEVIS